MTIRLHVQNAFYKLNKLSVNYYLQKYSNFVVIIPEGLLALKKKTLRM